MDLFSRPSPEHIEQLSQFGSATLHEVLGQQGALCPSLKPVSKEMHACGPAFTFQCPAGDNLMLQVALSYARPGDVVVGAMGGDPGYGVFGDLLATAAKERQLAGLVVDTSVRDAADLRAIGFPVFSKGLAIQGARKSQAGEMNTAIAVGGQVIQPGDVVKADEDGIVVIPQSRIEEVIESAKSREIMEVGKKKAYRAGNTVIEVNNLADAISKAGIGLPNETTG